MFTVKLDTLNREWDDLMSIIKPYSNEILNQQPKHDAWSAMQTMHHVRLSEIGSIAYCKKKLSYQPKLEKAGIISSIRGWLIPLYLASPLKFKAPKSVATANLPAHDELENMMQKWADERKQLKVFLETLPTEYLDKTVYKHPFAGRLSLNGMLDFFIGHFRRHRKQIMRAIKVAEQTRSDQK